MLKVFLITLFLKYSRKCSGFSTLFQTTSSPLFFVGIGKGANNTNVGENCFLQGDATYGKEFS